MTVQDAQRPCGKYQHSGHGEKDTNRRDRQHPSFAFEAGEEDLNEGRREQNAHQRQCPRDSQQNGEDGTRDSPRLLLPALFEQLRVHRNKRGAERAFSQQVLQDVRHPQPCLEYVRVERGTEVAGEYRLPNQPEYTAEQDARRHHRGGRPRPGSLFWG